MILNHAPSAISDLLRLASDIRSRMPEDSDALRWLCEVIQRSEKFVLPDGGRPIEDPSSIARVYDCLRLPFPITCMEYRVSGGVGPGARETLAPKRVAVAFEWPAFLDSFGVRFGKKATLEAELGDRDAKRIAVISMYFAEEIQHWVCVPHVGILHTESTPESIRLTASDIMAGQVRTNSWEQALSATFHSDRVAPNQRSFVYRTTMFPLLPNAAAMIERDEGPSEGLRTSLLDLGDELMATASLAAITSCANVKQEVITASPALNKKRTKTGKPPMFDYRTLVLNVTASGYEGVERRGSSPQQGTAHASPGEHVRRGHVRRLDESRTTWVNSVVVNPGVPRAVGHTYVLQHGRRPG